MITTVLRGVRALPPALLRVVVPGIRRVVPADRVVAPGIALLVVAANVVGAGVVTVLLLGVNGGSDAESPTGRLVTGIVGAGYLLLAIPVGVVLGLHKHRRTNRWLWAGRAPTPEEVVLALRMPGDVAKLVAWVWAVAAVGLGVVSAAVYPQALVGLRIGISVVLGGVVTAGVTYLLVARAARHVTARALAAQPPDQPRTLSVRRRLLLTWGLTSGVPMLGLILLVIDPTGQGTPGRFTAIFLPGVALVVGLLATLLLARGVGTPLRELRRAVQRIGEGETDVRVVVDDAGEIGLLQNGVNTMASGLAERERLRDLFGRHVGADVAARALSDGVELGGETRTVAALFVDVAGSTGLAERLGPQEMVGLLNRFFAVVVDATSAEGGLVNKFEGDAALCVFGAPQPLPDAAGAALRAARAICTAVAAAGEVEVGVGVAWGDVVAGQIGADSRSEYTVIGDAVNTAARLTELAKDHAGRAVASDAAVQAADAGERVHWVAGEEVVLRGRSEPTRLWVLAGG
ncbi:adenylate/guanylate cyclase domain-containing protein [Klenkia brasiliensis]|uniref:adenylate/guanylate cyclase domain-containing protein n=1 Tax=Klenkia brasiliensis TaxID=333142 RepID=UPI001A957BD4|nr:adenylate/guanylate cyclase domain-containing protein [Klenkia brasiliensis]